MSRGGLPDRGLAVLRRLVPSGRPSSRELWGYGVWLFAGFVFGVPEGWGGLGRPPWPALTDTIGHVESRWAPAGAVVAALMVLIVLAAIRHPLARAGKAARHGRTPEGWRQSGDSAATDLLPREPSAGPGRLAAVSDGPGAMRAPERAWYAPVFAYYPLALCAVAGGSLLAAQANSNIFLHGYVIYGLFAFFFVLIPNVAAVCLGRRIPFPTLASTVIYLERRWWPAGKIIVVGLVVLMIHLAVAPWPSLPLS